MDVEVEISKSNQAAFSGPRFWQQPPRTVAIGCSHFQRSCGGSEPLWRSRIGRMSGSRSTVSQSNTFTTATRCQLDVFSDGWTSAARELIPQPPTSVL